MSLRALGYLVTRRFAARGVPRRYSQVGSTPAIVSPGSAAGGPARSLRTMRDLVRGDGAYRAAATGLLAGFVAILYFRKDTEDPAVAGQLTAEEPRKQVPLPDTEVVKECDLNDAAIRAKFMDKDGTFAWRKYIDYLNDRDFRGGKSYKEEEAPAKQQEEYEDVKVDKAAMEARFQEWMAQYGRSYKSEEEKARRYGVFKENAMDVDRRNKRNASRPNGAGFSTNRFSDWTKEEWEARMFRSGEFPGEQYLAHRNSMIAQGRVMIGNETSDQAISEKQ